MFKFRFGGQGDPSPAQAPVIEVVRRRARHRLIGAFVLVIAGVIGFPLLFESQPRPVPANFEIDIPAKSGAKSQRPQPVAAPSASGVRVEGLDGDEEVVAPTPASTPAPVPARPLPAAVAPAPAAPVPAAPAPAAPASVLPVPRPALPVVVAPPVAQVVPSPAAKPEAPVRQEPVSRLAEPVVATSKPVPKVEPKPVAKVEAKPEPKPVPKVEPKPEPKPVPAEKPLDKGHKPAGDALRAQALLDDKPAAKAAHPESATGGRAVIQVGAFADADRAQDVRQKLERAGLPTSVHVTDTPNGQRTRVRVGPFASRAEADLAAAKVKALGLPAAVLTP